MTNDKGILIKNIYYMLTYAFQSLRQSNYDSVATEDFENIHDMFAAILGKGVANQLKQGLYKEYILQSEELSVLRGKLNLQGTIKNRTQHRQKLACEYDELSENNLLNRILKTTIMILIRQKTVKPDRKVLLKKNLILFENRELSAFTSWCENRPARCKGCAFFVENGYCKHAPKLSAPPKGWCYVEELPNDNL